MCDFIVTALTVTAPHLPKEAPSVAHYTFIFKHTDGMHDSIYNLSIRDARKAFEAAELKGELPCLIRDGDSDQLLAHSDWPAPLIKESLRTRALAERNATDTVRQALKQTPPLSLQPHAQPHWRRAAARLHALVRSVVK